MILDPKIHVIIRFSEEFRYGRGQSPPPQRRASIDPFGTITHHPLAHHPFTGFYENI